MSGWKLVGWGMLVVLVDLKFENVDLIVDVVGWLLASAGLRKLWRLDRAFRPAAGLASLGAVASLPELIPSYDFGGWLREGLLTLIWGAVVILTCTGLMRVADRVRDERVESRARWIRSAQVIAVALALAFGWRSDGELASGFGLLAVLAVVFGFGTAVAFILAMLSRNSVTTFRDAAIT
ncbi:MAG TPA: hypothetical protein VGD15_02105 [Kribbella sp.]|jgi:hypothetical protein